MNYHSIFKGKLGKMSQNLSSTAVVIDALKGTATLMNTMFYMRDLKNHEF